MTHIPAASIRSVELVTSDHLPECPDCRDYSPPGSTVCESCGSHLLVQTLLGRERPGLDTPPALPAEQWTCQNCLRDWPEPFCDECSRNLIARPADAGTRGR